jgi:cytochrome c553
MKFRSLAIACLFAVSAFVAAAAEGDPAAGKRKTVTGNACHGQSGFKSMPKLGGQSAAYLIAALRAYQEDRRAHATMREVARALSEKDIADLAAHCAAVPKVVGESTTTAPAGVERCAACHGADGAQPVAHEIALIAGQSAGYDQTLREYKSGCGACGNAGAGARTRRCADRRTCRLVRGAERSVRQIDGAYPSLRRMQSR